MFHLRSCFNFDIDGFHRARVDTAYACIMAHSGPEDAAHAAVFPRLSDPVSICRQDLS